MRGQERKRNFSVAASSEAGCRKSRMRKTMITRLQHAIPLLAILLLAFIITIGKPRRSAQTSSAPPTLRYKLRKLVINLPACLGRTQMEDRIVRFSFSGSLRLSIPTGEARFSNF